MDYVDTRNVQHLNRSRILLYTYTGNILYIPQGILKFK